MADQTVDNENASQVEEQQQERPEEEVYAECVLFPSHISQVWESEQPNQAVQQHLLNYIDRISQTHDRKYQDWDEFENRYEPSELKWLADFELHNLIFLKETLKLEDDVIVTETLDVLWRTLDLFSSDTELKDAAAFRFNKLREGLTGLFAEKKLNKD